jgi:hypothetical protein
MKVASICDETCLEMWWIFTQLVCDQSSTAVG